MHRRIRLDLWVVRTQYGLLKDEEARDMGFPYYCWPNRKDAARFLGECDAVGSPIPHGRPAKIRISIEELE